ncbi:unnamed protein product [Arabidopsis thaliana]|uniref:Hydroxyproline-rich glycoprotein family protein n=1 Tax=Arabidopsis thaliana TaxID=3702 RepID=Q9FM63_ARATH|nr:hydroxyproline-rich glycoprotein family protein [Arabidopsis thaliana]AED96676.1 hydroxyproline-rich glycoprotein family protein [Arabidopsis thaliana]BAB09242.1 unnamed protein product [Arabidopsis thaliana]|eukprot:NP_200386.1 hydroxyproline-rich glycoprotein family protein [Arabidopsis thaliana]
MHKQIMSLVDTFSKLVQKAIIDAFTTWARAIECNCNSGACNSLVGATYYPSCKPRLQRYSPYGNPPPPSPQYSPPPPPSQSSPPRSRCPPVPTTGCCNQPPGPPPSTMYSPPYPYFYTPPYPYGTIGGGGQGGGGQGGGGGGAEGGTTGSAMAYYSSSIPVYVLMLVLANAFIVF